MPRLPVHLVAIAAAGLLAPFWWTWAVGFLIHGFFIAAGSPSAPSAVFAWASVLIPSGALGFITGLGVSLLVSRPVLGWLIFVTGLMVGSLLFGSISNALEFALSPGTWAFVLVALIGAVLLPRANRPLKLKLPRSSA